MWKPFRTATARCAKNAAVLFDKFHIMRHLGGAGRGAQELGLCPIDGLKRRFIKRSGNLHAAVQSGELDLDGRRVLRELLAANRRLHVAYLLSANLRTAVELSTRVGWALRFFEKLESRIEAATACRIRSPPA